MKNLINVPRLEVVWPQIFLRCKISFIFLLLLLFMMSCKTSQVSYTELKAKAEQAIELARSVDAQEHAPDEFDSALDSFDIANQFVSENNTTEAITNFYMSIDYANNAYEISLPLHVQMLIDETDVMIGEAQKSLKSVALLEKTVELNQAAKDAHSLGDYLLAKEKTLAARDSIELAYEHAEQGLRANTLTRALQEGERFYQVKYDPEDRDCLWKIADRELGNPLSWRKIYNRNNDIIDNPNLIFPGQQLILPNVGR